MIHSVRGNYDVKRQTKQELNYRLRNVCSNDKTAELQKKNKWLTSEKAICCTKKHPLLSVNSEHALPVQQSQLSFQSRVFTSDMWSFFPHPECRENYRSLSRLSHREGKKIDFKKASLQSLSSPGLSSWPSAGQHGWTGTSQWSWRTHCA